MGRQFTINFSSGVVVAAASAVLMAIMYPFCLRWLGYERYGLWLLLTTVLGFAQLGNLGMLPALPKHVAQSYSTGDMDGVRSYVTTALLMLASSGVVVATVVIGARHWIVDLLGLTADERALGLSLLPFVALLSVYVFLVDTFNATLSGLGRQDLMNAVNLTGQLINVGCSIALVLCGFGIHGLLIGMFVQQAVIHIATYAAIRRVFGEAVIGRRCVSAKAAGEMVRFGGSLISGSLVGLLVSPLNKVMLSRYAGVGTVPIYEIAFNGCMKLRSIVEVGIRAVMPEVSRLKATGESRISALYSQILRWLLPLSAAGYALAFLLADPFLTLWLGAGRPDELPAALRIALIGSFFNLLSMPAFYTLMGLGKAGVLLMSAAVQSSTNVVAVSLLILLPGGLTAERLLAATSVAMFTACLYLLKKNRTVLEVEG
jgi:O-antigen/teichoic acid export membrane protein